MIVIDLLFMPLLASQRLHAGHSMLAIDVAAVLNVHHEKGDVAVQLRSADVCAH